MERNKQESSINTQAALLNSEKARAVNFREIRAGKIARCTLYRGSHPVKDNKQEKVIALLAAETRIASVLNLADTDAELSIKALFAPWYSKLLKQGRVIALGMDFSTRGAGFYHKLKKALQFIVHTEGPWLVHCYAGVDRTGFVSMVLEAFMGASLYEIAVDYLESFNGVFESSIYGGLNSADTFAVMKQLSAMSDSPEINDGNLQEIAELYLLDKIALSLEEIETLKEKLGCSSYTPA